MADDGIPTGKYPPHSSKTIVPARISESLTKSQGVSRRTTEPFWNFSEMFATAEISLLMKSRHVHIIQDIIQLKLVTFHRFDTHILGVRSTIASHQTPCLQVMLNVLGQHVEAKKICYRKS